MVRLWRYRIVFLVIGICVTNAAAGPSCSENLANLISEVSFSYSKVSRLQQWRKNPDLDHDLNRYVLKLLSLSPEQKKHFLDKALRYNVNERELKVLKLLFYDPDEWNRYVTFLAKHGDFYGFLSNSFWLVLRKMPKNLKENLMHYATSLYPRALKTRDIPKGQRVDAPKRALDLLLRNLLPPDQIITQEISENHSTLHAYSTYLQMNQSIFSHVDGFAKYNANDAMTVYKRIQNFLKDQSDLPPEQKRVLLFGSFPGGRTNLSSPEGDIDLYYYNPDLEKQFGKLREAILKDLKPSHPATKIYISGHLEEDYSPVEAARVSPIQIEITPDKINLLLYSEIKLSSPDAKYPNMKPMLFEFEK